MSLELKKITKRVGADVTIHETSLVLEERSFNTLLGPTLAGKTTLMQLMAGLDRPTSGEIWFRGTNVTGIPVQKRNVSMVYQQFINYPNFTVFENIASPLRVAGLDAGEIKRRVAQAADLLRLTPMLQRRPNELSGGQQQRTAIARAIVKDSDIILLDEPLANLDYKLREELRDELPKFFADRNCIVVYATTEPTEALLLGGNTATLHRGAVTQFGPTLDVYRRPVDRITAEVFSDPPMNFVPARVGGGAVQLPGGVAMPALGPLAGLGEGDVTLGFRPNHLFLRRSGLDAVAITAIVLVVEITGSESFVHVEHEAMRWVSLAHGVHELKPGAPVEIFLDPHRMFVFDRDQRLVAAPALAAAA